MDLIDRDELRIIVYGTGRCNGKTALIEAISKIVTEAPTVDAIPVEWIENYIYDLNTGKQTHHLDADEYISNSDEVYYLRYLLKKWKQEKHNGNSEQN